MKKYQACFHGVFSSLSQVLDKSGYIRWQRGYIVLTSNEFFYDSEKSPVGFVFTDSNDSTNKSNAWYIKNLQGDVTGVYVEGEGLAICYEYDSFGHVEILAGDLTGWDAVGCMFTNYKKYSTTASIYTENGIRKETGIPYRIAYGTWE